jgi:hypothetical protein
VNFAIFSNLKNILKKYVLQKTIIIFVIYVKN